MYVDSYKMEKGDFINNKLYDMTRVSYKRRFQRIT